MKQEELKLLAEYLNNTKYSSVSKDWLYNEDGEINLEILDMLEDKMINELRIKYKTPVNISNGVGSNGDFFLCQISANINKEKEYKAEIQGKTKNESRLNAILNYVKGLK